MGWFSKKQKEGSSIVDPEFGVMRSEGRIWHLSLPLANRPNVDVQISGAEFSDAHRQAIRELRDRADALFRGPIADDLHEMETDASRSTERDAVFQVYEIDGVSLELQSGKVFADFGFTPTWSRDHYVTVHFEDWKSAGVSIDS